MNRQPTDPILSSLQAALLEYLLEKLEKGGVEFTSLQLSFAVYNGDNPFLRRSWVAKIGRRLSNLAERGLIKKRLLRGIWRYSVIPNYAKRTLEKYRRELPQDRVQFSLF